MGRTIGGFFAGFTGMALISGILGVVLAFAMGPESIIDLETKEPKQLWLIVGIIAGGAGAFFGGYFARAIGKSIVAPLSLMVLVLLIATWGFFSGPVEIPKELLDQLDAAPMSAVTAMRYAGINGQDEQGMNILRSVVQLLALAVGGLKIADFATKKQDSEPNQDMTE